jgi:hypothetical protein
MAPEWVPEEFVTDLRHELRTRGIPSMDLMVNFHDDGGSDRLYHELIVDRIHDEIVFSGWPGL